MLLGIMRAEHHVIGQTEFHALIYQLLDRGRQRQCRAARLADFARGSLDRHPCESHQLLVEDLDTTFKAHPVVGVGEGFAGPDCASTGTMAGGRIRMRLVARTGVDVDRVDLKVLARELCFECLPRRVHFDRVPGGNGDTHLYSL